jgi:hypothetical protein
MRVLRGPLLLLTEPEANALPIKSEIPTDANRRQRVLAATAGLLIDPTLRHLQTLRKLGEREYLGRVYWIRDYSNGRYSGKLSIHGLASRLTIPAMIVTH